MAPYLFMKAVMEGEPIRVFNQGRMQRDFTYIDDIIEGLTRIIAQPSVKPVPYQIYNIGNSHPVELLHFIAVIEQVTGRKAEKQLLPMQPGDVVCTCADMSRMQRDFGYQPTTRIEEGVRRFYEWYVEYQDA